MLKAKPTEEPWLLFTDGALEYDDEWWPMCFSYHWRSTHFSDWRCSLLWRWGASRNCHALEGWWAWVIGLVELYACATALEEWKELVCDQRVVLFIDNYGAQDCLVKGSASVETWRQLLLRLEEIYDSLFANMWVTRVASASNPADFPSRGSLKELEFLGKLNVCNPVCPLTGKALVSNCWSGKGNNGYAAVVMEESNAMMNANRYVWNATMLTLMRCSIKTFWLILPLVHADAENRSLTEWLQLMSDIFHVLIYVASWSKNEQINYLRTHVYDMYACTRVPMY